MTDRETGDENKYITSSVDSDHLHGRPRSGTFVLGTSERHSWAQNYFHWNICGLSGGQHRVGFEQGLCFPYGV